MTNNEKTREITGILSNISIRHVEMFDSLLADKDAAIFNLENELKWLKQQIKLGQQKLFGRSTEKLASLQLPFIFNEDESEVIEVKKVDEKTQSIQYVRRKVKQCGRKIDTSKLLRERQLHDLPESEKICACGCQLEKIGEDISEQIDHIKEQLKVIEHIRPKYTCRQCETIKSEKKPESPLPKSMATAKLITDVVIKKYEHHLPLYRQSKIFFGQGLDIPDNTLGNWVMGAAEVLFPLRDALYNQFSKVYTLQADETPVTVLKPHKEGYLWAYHSCDSGNRFIFFEFNLTRSGENADRLLKNFQGLLQTDGYPGYNGLRKKESVINFGCWDHARRKFAEVVKINGNNKEGKAGEMLLHIEKLYEIEKDIKEVSIENRKLTRHERSKPILDLIFSKLNKIQAPPQSALGKAITYCLNQWSYLSRYVDYGEIEISNCWIENQIRPFALGRRNWLFVGNEQSANKSALLYSLIQTCKLNNIDPRLYLEYVLNHVHKMRRKEIDPTSLLPQFINKNLLK
jgi:transposase